METIKSSKILSGTRLGMLTISFFENDRFFNDNPSLTFVNDDPSLTIVKIIVNKFVFKNDRFLKNNRVKNGRKSFL